ncbi:MAG TPA: hypothetical protein DCR12_07215 [Lachnospiraceae bacterium]|nr:hypothetical protein [Lachnospiraceae bacterium]
MKLLNKKQKNNKGFSLVELIVVIAIMVVLVAVLAPVFTRYIESSRRSTDVQNANSISEAVLADVADGKDVTATDYTPSAIKEWPIAAKGSAADKGKDLTYEYDASTNHCCVYVTGKKGEKTVNDNKYYTGDLTIEENATAYKNTKEAGTFPGGDAE